MLPLPQDLVSQGLDARALTLLCPPPLGSPLCVFFHPCEREAGVATSQELFFWAFPAIWHVLHIMKSSTVLRLQAWSLSLRDLSMKMLLLGAQAVRWPPAGCKRFWQRGTKYQMPGFREDHCGVHLCWQAVLCMSLSRCALHHAHPHILSYVTAQRAKLEVLRYIYGMPFQASNSTNIRQAFHFSVSCHDGSHLRGRFEGAFDTSSAMAAGRVSGKGYIKVVIGCRLCGSLPIDCPIICPVRRIAIFSGPRWTCFQQCRCYFLPPGRLLPVRCGHASTTSRSSPSGNCTWKCCSLSSVYSCQCMKRRSCSMFDMT